MRCFGAATLLHLHPLLVTNGQSYKENKRAGTTPESNTINKKGLVDVEFREFME